MVQPRMAAAGESSAAGRLAVNTFLAFQRQLALLEGEEQVECYMEMHMIDLLDKAYMVCIQEESELCVELIYLMPLRSDSSDVTIHGGELFAERIWQCSDPSNETTEQGSMKLWHRPGE